VKTVESNLTRVYRKLGVRSRVGLANALHGAAGEPPQA
jgi:DNA-binding CsgD family transcriptional regulator